MKKNTMTGMLKLMVVFAVLTWGIGYPAAVAMFMVAYEIVGINTACKLSMLVGASISTGLYCLWMDRQHPTDARTMIAGIRKGISILGWPKKLIRVGVAGYLFAFLLAGMLTVTQFHSNFQTITGEFFNTPVFMALAGIAMLGKILDVYLKWDSYLKKAKTLIRKFKNFCTGVMGTVKTKVDMVLAVGRSFRASIRIRRREDGAKRLPYYSNAVSSRKTHYRAVMY